ncbi:MAG TPA: SPFH domain-containing protein [Vicinamibacterales bacterium]|nr:SPFH domain-containing protein [Vicinamibacterales bacterium]
MLTLVWEHLWFFVVAVPLIFVGLAVIASSVRIVGANESGLVIKRFGPPLASGRIVALNGEAGYQARMLPPGWHFFLWRVRYRVLKVPTVVVRPGEIALVVAADGAAMPSERVLGKAVACTHFQDAEAFLTNGGERGRQITLLTAGTYRINPALFDVITTAGAARTGLTPADLRVYQVQPDRVGIVTMLDGRPITAGDLAGPVVPGHESFQRGQAFIDAGGCRGLQEEVLLSGAWNLNPWLVQVEQVPLVEVPIGYVGVVVSYVGKEHLDVSGESFTHGDLVERGRKGVWVEPLLPGKHPLNTKVMKVELVPTTNIVLNWAQRTEAHHYDERLSSIIVRSNDGFSFSLDVSQIIHIGMRNAPRVISRVGSMQNLVDHVLQPTVGNYFRNSAQQVTVLEFLSARSERQRNAFENIRKAIEAYDVECIDTLVGDIAPPADLMKTQTDRKIAEELERTYEVQREAQIKRQALERETAVANLQGEVVRSEQMVKVAQQDALAAAERARGEGSALELRAQGQAASVRLAGDAEAAALRAVGAAKAEAYKLGIEAVGASGYTAMQIATILGEHHVKVVPEIAVTGDGAGAGMANVMLAKLVAAAQKPDMAKG